MGRKVEVQGWPAFPTKGDNMTKYPKPQSFEELKQLVDSGLIEVLLSEDNDDGTMRVLVCDSRLTYEEGEIYELNI